MKKRHVKVALAWLLAISTMAGSVRLDVRAENSANAEVTISEDKVSIGNGYISREYGISENHILTSKITNNRITKDLIPAEGSEDFVINTIAGEKTLEEPEGDAISNDPQYEVTVPEALNREAWTAMLTNKDGKFSQDHVKRIFDGDLSTHPDEYDKAGGPFTLDIDLGEKKTISAMSVNKRPGYTNAAYGINGTMGGYEILVKGEGSEEYTPVKEGAFTAEDYNLHKVGDLYNVGDMVWVNLDTPVETQHVRVIQKTVAMGSSDEFSTAELNFYSEAITKTQKVAAPTQVLDRSGWNVTIKNSAGDVFSDEHTAKLTDGELTTNPDECSKSGHPITVDIDLGTETTVSSLSIDKRPGYTDAAYGLNGTMGKFKLYVSDDGANYKFAGAGEFTGEAYNLHQDGNLYNVGDRVYANFKKTYTTRYVRLVQESCAFGTAQEFTSSELNLYSDPYVGPNWNTDETAADIVKTETKIKSSALTYTGAASEDIENGKKLTISYAPYEMNGVTYSIKQIVILENDKHYMNSYLEISVPEDSKAKAQIDYIDLDRFVLPGNVEGLWSHPAENKISSMWIQPHELMLGQPIYVNGLFMGSEFPAADTRVSDNETEIRYYSGKTFTRLGEDGQLQEDGTTFRTWWNVIGSATGTGTAVVQTDFFDYIEDIATPSEFRKQYNSWYDNMMNITDESIAKSFYGAEKGLAQNGVEPLDSYVVDDGWNNYYSVIGETTYVGQGNSQGSGTPNQTGFWEFNNKFPNELYTSSALSDKFQSTFGLWLGPQGGYNYFTGFAQYLEASGTGYAQSDYWTNICVGSEKYVNNLQTLFIDYQERFNIDYWKWDGFSLRPCTNASHDHMTGGANDMYYTTDLWEKWTDLFDAVRLARAEDGKGLWINATCYVNLSPWLLQWVNTIWVQDSGDTGEAGTGERHQQKIYYRDQVYYQLYKQNQIQFPMKNIYNHDPIYGVSDSSNATTEVFREFLFANAVRGTAFWELYYSPSIMDDEKWEVTADALAWAEENHEILKNAKLHGGKPIEDNTANVYGYSCWNGNEGIISFTNPSDAEKTYELAVSDAIGANASLSNVKGIQVYPYVAGEVAAVSYGDTISVTLQPHTTVIYQYGAKISEPQIISAKSTGEKELTVKFDERIADGTYTVDGKAVEGAEVQADYRTVVLTTKEALPEGKVTVAVKAVKAADGTTYDRTVDVNCYDRGVIAEVFGKENLNETADLTRTYDNDNKLIWIQGMNGAYTVNTDHKLSGTGEFTIATGVKTTETGMTLVDTEDVKVSVNEEGYVQFKVGALEVNSKETVTTVTEKAHGLFGTDAYVPTATTTSTKGKVNDGTRHLITAVREANGMIKLYIDGALAASAYDESKINENLAGGQITVGSQGFVGELAQTQILNYALAYDELTVEVPELEAVKSERSGWSASACSECSGTTGDAKAQAAIDGSTESWWHTNYSGGDTCTGKHLIKIDFGKEETFDQFMYQGRGRDGNGAIKEYQLDLLNQSGDSFKTFTGSFPANMEENWISLGQEYKAYGLTLTVVSTHNGNNFGSAVEINIGHSIAPVITKVSDENGMSLTEWKNEANTPLCFHLNVNSLDVRTVYVDGKPVSGTQYEIVLPDTAARAAQDHVMIVLSQEFLASLSNGEHTLCAVTNAGDVTENFMISGNTDDSDQGGSDQGGSDQGGSDQGGSNQGGSNMNGSSQGGSNTNDSKKDETSTGTGNPTPGTGNPSEVHPAPSSKPAASGTSNAASASTAGNASTGDSTQAGVWMTLMAAAVFGCMMMAKRRKENE